MFLFLLASLRVAAEPNTTANVRVPFISDKNPPVLHNILRLLNWNCQDKQKLVMHVKGAFIVEVGAFEGEELHMFKNYAKRVISIEPSHEKIPKVHAAVKTAGMENMVRVLHAAASDVDGDIDFYQLGTGSQQDAIGKQPFSGATKRSVKSVRIDTLVNHTIHLLKIDVQGAELKVLKGASKLLEKGMIDVVHMELSPNLAKAMELDPAEQLLYLAKYGFACFDCEAFGPPGLDDARNMREYVKRFAPFQFGNGDHGLWTDIVCFRSG